VSPSGMSGSVPDVRRFETAGYLPRTTAALLDGLVLYAIFVAIERMWISSLTDSELLLDKPPLPTSITILVAACVAFYIVGTGLLGRTLGMSAVELRITRADDTAATWSRLLLRAVVLVAVVAVLWWIEPFLLLAYPLWILFNGKQQMLHDQVSDTVVVRRAAPVATPRAVLSARAQLGGLAPPTAGVLLDDLDRLRLNARAKVHTASLPIFVLGLLASCGMAANWVSNVSAQYANLGYFYWALAGPLGLTATAWWFYRQQRVLGAGTRVGPLVLITLLVACAALVTAPYSLGGLITGAGFLAVAVVQHSRLLAAAAVAFGLVTGLEPARAALSGMVEYGLSGAYSRFYFGSFETVFDFLAPGVLGLILIAAGAVAFRRERTR